MNPNKPNTGLMRIFYIQWWLDLTNSVLTKHPGLIIRSLNPATTVIVKQFFVIVPPLAICM